MNQIILNLPLLKNKAHAFFRNLIPAVPVSCCLKENPQYNKDSQDDSALHAEKENENICRYQKKHQFHWPLQILINLCFTFIIHILLLNEYFLVNSQLPFIIPRLI